MRPPREPRRRDLPPIPAPHSEAPLHAAARRAPLRSGYWRSNERRRRGRHRAEAPAHRGLAPRRQFRSFPEEGAQKLTRARLEVLDRILLAADRHAVDAVLCAGDLFDEPLPLPEWWEQTAARLLQNALEDRPVFLLPGNHDPLTTELGLGQGATSSGVFCRTGSTSSIARTSSHRSRTAPCSTPCRACRRPASAIRPSRSRTRARATSASASAWCTAARST